MEEAVAEGVEELRRAAGVQDARRVRIEGDGHGPQPPPARLADRAAHDRLVAAVDAVENPDADGARLPPHPTTSF
jgi:hypothetical protein